MGIWGRVPQKPFGYVIVAYMPYVQKKTGRYKNALSVKIREWFWVGIIIALLLVFANHCVGVMSHPLKYDSIGRYQLLLDLNKRDEKAIAFYREEYVKDGVYLFNGQLTFYLVCEYKGISEMVCDGLYANYLEKRVNMTGFWSHYKP
jgi:hypothetical protein